MAEFSGFTKSESLEDQVASIKKTLEWLLNNLDHSNVRQLYTEYCKIQSEDGSTEIKGAQIIMKDNNGVTRAILGFSLATLLFVFQLMNASGQTTMELDSNGDAIFRGNISTAKDAHVGNYLYIGDPSAAGYKGVIFRNSGGSMVSISVEPSGRLNIGSTGGISIESDIGVVVFDESTSSIRVTSYGDLNMSAAGSINLTHSGTISVNEDELATVNYVTAITSGFATNSDISNAIAAHVAAYHTP